MKQGWEIKKLAEVCEEIFAGGDVPKNNFSKTKSDKYNIPIFTNGEKFKGFYGYTDIAKVIKPSITISARGTIGYSEIREEIFYPAIRLIVIIPNRDILDLYYLKYVVSNLDFKFSGTSIPQLTVPMIKLYEIPLPPLPEQQRIVSILDEAFVAIAKAKANAEQNLKNAKELFESYLQSIFENKGEGWEEKSIGELCYLMTGGTPRSSKLEFYQNGKIRWLVSGDVNIEEIIDCEGRITELGFESSNTKYLPVNSVIIALNGQGKTRGTVAMLRIKATCNQSLVSIYPKDIKKLLPEYIFYNLKVRYQEIRKITGDGGNDRRGLNMPLIRNIKIHFPKSINQQKNYVEKFISLLAKTKKLESIYQQKINDFEELKKSILQKAFAGELHSPERAETLNDGHRPSTRKSTFIKSPEGA